MIVTITLVKENQEQNLTALEISDFCPVCGGPRGKVFGSHSYDGSRRLNADSCNNPCGHIDAYADVRCKVSRLKTKNTITFIP